MSHSDQNQSSEKVSLWLQQRGFKLEKNKNEQKYIPMNNSENFFHGSRPPSTMSNRSTDKNHMNKNSKENLSNKDDNIEHLSRKFSNTQINENASDDDCGNGSKVNGKATWLNRFSQNANNENNNHNDDADISGRTSCNNNRSRIKNSYNNGNRDGKNKDEGRENNGYRNNRNRDNDRENNDYRNNRKRNDDREYNGYRNRNDDREYNGYRNNRNRENNAYRNNRNRDDDRENNGYVNNRNRDVDRENNGYGNNRNRTQDREHNGYRNNRNNDKNKNHYGNRDRSNDRNRNSDHENDRNASRHNEKYGMNRENNNYDNGNRNRRQNYGMRNDRYENNSNMRKSSFNDRNEYQNRKDKYNNDDDWDSDNDNRPRSRNTNSKFKANDRPGSDYHKRSEKEKGRLPRNNDDNDSDGSGCNPKPRRNYGRDSNNKDDYFRNNIYEKNSEDRGRAPKVNYIPSEENETDLFKDVPKSYNIDRFYNFNIEVSGSKKPREGYSCFEQSDLSPLVLKNVQKMNYSELTPIQKWAMPVINMGRDLLACSETGSGKTAAFLLPIISKMLSMDLYSNKGKVQPIALIISPTRELAIQTHKEALKFSYNTPLKTAVLYGGVSVEHQKNMMKNVHLLVVTTGRLCDFVQRNMLDLSNLKFLVCDEGDQMLSDNFVDSIHFIIEKTGGKANPDRQTMFFSATFPIEVQELSCSILNDYIFVAVGILGQANLDIKQEVLRVPYNEKTQMVTEILKNIAGDMKTIVFLNKKKTADSLCISLSEILETSMTAIHGDLDQKERETVMSRFRKSEARVLMATSVAARGLDISNVGCVINYDLPNNIDEYVHRIGRTARCGNKGRAISFFTEPDNNPLANSLLRVLSDADQVVPEWLEKIAKGNSHRPRNDFNKKDFRKGRERGIDLKKSSIIEESSRREMTEDDDDDWD